MKIKKIGFYVANTDDAIAYSRDISRCKQYANKKIKKWNIQHLSFGLYDAEDCEYIKGAIIPKANAVPIWLFREGVWIPNQEYIY